MINVAALMPTDIERLMADGLAANDKASILQTLERMVIEVAPDGGADTDRVYMAASMLSMAKVWDQIGADELAKSLAAAHRITKTAFLDGLPHAYAGNVALALVAHSDIEELLSLELENQKLRNALSSKLLEEQGIQVRNYGGYVARSGQRLFPGPLTQGATWAAEDDETQEAG
ncbi:hypothetical protein GFM44_23455 [Rhizobium leguminosarum bv. viciae]|nr:hypothetical protein [Rhizobium leguminosarum bv. viciae]